MTQVLLYCPDWRGSPPLQDRLAPIKTIEAQSLAHAFELLRQDVSIGAFFAQITDITTLERLTRQFPTIPIIIIDPKPSIQAAVQVIRVGVADYIGIQEAASHRLHAIYEAALRNREDTLIRLRLLRESLESLQALADRMLPQDNLTALMPLHVEALTRQSHIICIRQVCIDELHQIASFRDNAIDLSPTEFDILHTLILANGKLVSFEDLASSVHGVNVDRTQARTLLSAHISNLRNKLRDVGCDNYIVNRRGRGYFIDTDAEQALQRRDIELQTIVNNTQDIIVFIDSDGVLDYISPSLTHVLGYEVDDLVGHSLDQMRSIIHAEDVGIVDAVAAAIANSTPLQFSARALHADQSWIWLEASANPIRTDGGMVVVLRDVTTRVAALNNLARSEARFRTLVESSPNFILIINRDGIIQFLNKAPEPYAETEFIGLSILSYAIPERHEAVRENIARAFEGEPIEDLMQVSTLANYDWINLHYVPLLTDDTVTEVMVIVSDVTSYKHALEELRENEARFRMLSNHMTDLVALHDADGTFIYLSPSSRRLLGYDADELVGKAAYDICHPEDKKIFRRKGHNLILQGHGVVGLVFRAKCRDGHYIWFETNLEPVIDSDREVTQFVSVSRDVTFRTEDEQDEPVNVHDNHIH